jgi:hypothetical protein
MSVWDGKPFGMPWPPGLPHMDETAPDALSVPCPRCLAAVGEPCKGILSSIVESMGLTHSARTSAARGLPSR